MDIMHACRCCLRRPPDKDLTTPYALFGKTEIYADMIKDCFDIHLALDAPGSCGICSACVGRLRDASDFKLQVQRSQAELQALLYKADPVVKSEQTEDNVEDKFVYDVLYEEPILFEQSEIGEMANEVMEQDPLFKSEADDAMSDDDTTAGVCSEGSAAYGDTTDTTVHTYSRAQVAKPFGCKHCKERFKNKCTLKEHILRKHLSISTGPKLFACGFCSSTFRTKLLVLEHERIEHGVTSFMCGECGHITIEKSSLEAHLKTHSTDIVSCTQSSYVSQSKSDIPEHLVKNIADLLSTHKQKHQKLHTLREHLRIAPKRSSHSNIDSTMKTLIISMHIDGLNKSEIARETGLNRKTVSMWVDRYQKEGSLLPRPKTGRPCLIDTKQREFLVREYMEDGGRQTKLYADLFGASPLTVRRVLRKEGLRFHKPAVNPKRSKKNGIDDK
ncbi:zinc finger protein 333-like isoform X2 [Leguminivora glycinivorella]|uniref:zinc finger protein 333-like isoform X2 n=1 Tax=Leguminivora glycinivorella TaxID=1035111 RepID=UPI00200CC99F|nr:zinc finger protein 333-like isoform X2 [Leguminivora glycinivorella]